MKNYSQTSENFLRANRLKRVYLRNSVGELIAAVKTDKQLSFIRSRGISVHDSR